METKVTVQPGEARRAPLLTEKMVEKATTKANYYERKGLTPVGNLLRNEETLSISNIANVAMSTKRGK